MATRDMTVLLTGLVMSLLLGCESAPSVPSLGTRIGAGAFRQVVVGGTLEDGAFVLATSDEATVHRFALSAGGDSCSFGPAEWYSTSAPTLGPELEVAPGPARIALVDTGRLRFAGAGCERSEPMLAAEIELPIGAVSVAETRFADAYLARTTGGELWRLDPWSGEAVVLASGVSWWSVGRSVLWTIEAGALVARSLTGEELMRVGSAAEDAVLAPDGAEVAYVDESGLHVATLEDRAVTDIEPGACRPRYLGVVPRLLAFASPCGSPALAFVRRDDGTRVELGAIDEVRTVGRWIFFTTAPDGMLRALPIEAVDAAAAIAVGAGGDPSLVFQRGADRFFVALADTDGSQRVGTWSPSAAFAEILTASAVRSTWGGLLVVRTPVDGRTALVRINATTLEIDPIAEDVVAGSVQTAFAQPAVGYLTGGDRPRFEAAWLSPRHTVVIAENVSEFREVFWPEQGVIYVVREGSDAGLWWVRLADLQ